MTDFLKWLLTGILPPRDIHNEEIMYRWHTAVASAIVLWSLLLVLVTAFAFGFVPGFQGFAMASDLNNQVILFANISENQKKTAIRDLDSYLTATRERQCLADKADNGVAVHFATERIRYLSDQYYTLTSGRQWISPTCRELGID